MTVLSARVWNNSGAFVGAFERNEFDKACESIVDDDKVVLEFEEYSECGAVGLVDCWTEDITGAEFVRLYGEQ